MLIGIFKSNQKIINVIAVLLLILLWIPGLIFDFELGTNLITRYRWLDLLLALMLISFQSIYLNIVVGEFKLVKDSSHLTSLFYILINSCLVWLFSLNVVLIANTFTLLAFHQFLRLYSSKNSYAIIFSAGLLIGVAGLIYAPLFSFFILLWIVLLYTTTPTWRDFLIALFGGVLPLVYFATYHFVWLDITSFNVDAYFNQIFVVEPEGFELVHQFFFLIFIVLITLSLFNVFNQLGKSIVKTSKMMIVVLLMFGISVATFFLNHNDFLATLIVMSVPLSIMFAILFQNIKRKWLSELLFLLLLLSIVVGYFS
ncbi:MAG: DUF6427 family protein [Vicingaceae bacterium]